MSPKHCRWLTQCHRPAASRLALASEPAGMCADRAYDSQWLREERRTRKNSRKTVGWCWSESTHMRLSHKFAKLVQADSYLSIWRGIGRALHPQPVEKFLRCIDPTLMPTLAARHGDALRPGENWTKYFDAGRWLELNIRRAQDIGLDRCGRPLRVLDLGSGAGYFLFVCKHLGHKGTGLDVPEPVFYGEMFEHLGLARVVAPIEARRGLPEALRESGPFDLVTAFSIEFNKYGVDGRWSAADWNFLLDDLRSRFLVPGGRIYFDLNPTYDGEFMTPEIRATFLWRGARIDRRSKLLFDPLR